MKTVFHFLILLSSISLLPAQQLTQEQEAAITTYLEQLTADETEPGFVVGVVSQGEVVYRFTQGLASLQHRVPITEKSAFNVASVAKQFTALLVLKAARENKLSLDNDLRKFYPDFYPDIESPILIRQLLNHSSGIRDYCDLMSIQFNAWWRREGLDNEDAIELLSKQKDLNFTPGTDHLYSNSNYILLAGVVAKVTGVSFPDYAKAFFTSLGMENTFYLENYMAVIPDLALPYADWGDGVWQQYPMMVNLHGDGFLYTTLEDQLVFEKAVQRAIGTQDLLGASQKAIPNANRKDYGYGLELGERLGFSAVHHAGGTGAYHAQTVRYPEQELSIVVMSNNSQLWSGYIADAVVRKILPEQTTKASPKVDDTAQPEVAPVTEAYVPTTDYLQTLVGEYWSEEVEVSFKIFLDKNDELKVRVAGKDRVYSGEIVQKDELKLSDFTLRVSRNEFNYVKNILLSYSRVVNVKFVRTAYGKT